MLLRRGDVARAGAGAEELTPSEHGRIVDAIAKRDPDAAAAAMHAHLSRANTLYLRLIMPQ